MARASRRESSRRDGKRSHLSRAKEGIESRPWGVLIAANALPIMAVLVIGTLWAKGTIEFVPEAKKVWPSLIVLGLTLVILVVIAWIIAPALFPLLRRTRESLDRNLRLMRSGGPVMIPLRLLLIILGTMAYGVLWANLVVLGLLAVVDVAAILASLAVFVREVLRAKG